jgi:hypothetical protein
MAKIFSVPKGMNFPEFDWKESHTSYDERVKKFEAELKQMLQKRNPTDKNAGEVISFPVADGKAVYMVASSMGKCELVHLPYLDGYQFQYDYLLTKKEIEQKINQRKSLEKLFSK